MLKIGRNWLKIPLLLVVLSQTLVVVGCNSKPAQSMPAEAKNSQTGETDEPATPESTLHEQLSSGAYQTGAAVDSLVEAINRSNLFLKVAKGASHKQAVQDLLGLLESAGQGVADYIEQPANVDAVKVDMAGFDEIRLKAIDALNDALFEVREAGGIADSLAPELSGEAATACASLQESINVSIDALTGAIEAYGGKVEESL